jgi:hypothetical protein
MNPADFPRSSKSLFIFTEAESNSPAVEEWFANEPQLLFALARDWFSVFRQCGDDVSELLHDGCPTACINGAAFGYVNVFKAHINVGFFNGAYLDDPGQLLEGAGKHMRHVKLKPGEDLDSEALSGLIRSAYQDVKQLLSA